MAPNAFFVCACKVQKRHHGRILYFTNAGRVTQALRSCNITSALDRQVISTFGDLPNKHSAKSAKNVADAHPFSHGALCHGSRWIIADEDDLTGREARLTLGQAGHVAAILSGIDTVPPETRADAARGAIKLLTVATGKPLYHRNAWVFQAISWISAHRGERGAIIRAPHMIQAIRASTSSG